MCVLVSVFGPPPKKNKIIIIIINNNYNNCYSLYNIYINDWKSCHNASLVWSLMLDPLSFFSFKAVLHNWLKRLWYVLSCLWDGAHKKPLLLNGKSSPCGGSGFPLLLSEWSFSVYMSKKKKLVSDTHYSQCSMTGVTKAVVCAILSVRWVIQKNPCC